MESKLRVLVTGGCGFIGTALVRALHARGDRVAVLDTRGAFPEPEVASIVGDVRDPEARQSALAEQTDAIVHLAARTSVLGSLQAPEETFAVNASATMALLELARMRGVQRFVFTSTNAVVGAGTGDGELIDERSTLRPLTPYGASKAAAEMAIQGYAAAYGVGAATLRLTNVYGPGMGEAGKDSIVARLLRLDADGGALEVYGDGGQVRDYVYVDDVVRALTGGIDGGFSETVVLGAGRSVSVLELVTLAGQAAGRELPVRHGAARGGEMRAVRVDISRARELGIAPRVDLGEGLRETWRQSSAARSSGRAGS